MTVSVANTSNTSTFQYWLDRTNELADAMSNKVVTVDSNTATGNSTVNGTFTATNLTANTLRGGNNTTSTILTISSNVLISTGNNFTVGNSTVNTNITNSTISTNSYITVGNSTVNSFINSTSLSLGNSTVNTSVNTSVIVLGNSSVNVTINSTSINFSSGSILPASVNSQTSGLSTQTVDSINLSVYRGADYIITITDNNANAFQISRILMVHDTGNTYISEYGIMYTNNQLGSFSADANATHSRLLITPTSTNTQIKTVRITLPI